MVKNKNEFFLSTIRTHNTELKYYAYRKTGNYDLVPDILQELFLLFYNKIDHVMVHPDPKGWLFKSLKHICQKKLRQLMVRNEVPLEEAMDVSYYMQETAAGNTLLEILPAKLSEEECRFLKMVYEEELSHKEIAIRLGIKEDASRQRLVRVKKRCRKLNKK
ncbi:MAG: RNA polymerase sigma factor [Prevotellaceae bacterium]|jgi:RNA polymerase sigma-70 factor (ECF subfamily)|nr:RNA polymerase sigma factor [Prevotellaceae bacterium]